MVHGKESWHFHLKIKSCVVSGRSLMSPSVFPRTLALAWGWGRSAQAAYKWWWNWTVFRFLTASTYGSVTRGPRGLCLWGSKCLLSFRTCRIPIFLGHNSACALPTVQFPVKHWFSSWSCLSPVSLSLSCLCTGHGDWADDLSGNRIC